MKGDNYIRNTKQYAINNYFTISNNIFKYDLKSKEIHVYCYLKRLAGNTQTCFPSVKDIAKHCNMSTNTASAAIKNLEAEGLIDVRHRYDGENNLSNLYTILKI